MGVLLNTYLHAANRSQIHTTKQSKTKTVTLLFALIILVRRLVARNPTLTVSAPSYYQLLPVPVRY